MSDGQNTTDVNVFGGPLDKTLAQPNKLLNRRIIKSQDLPELTKTVTIGGDCADDNSEPPSIIIEREGDQITKIIVKCTCGRHAELVCEVEEDDEETLMIENKTVETAALETTPEETAALETEEVPNDETP